MIRCEWGDKSLLYQQYHDEEWGVPVHDDRPLFEFLMLEGAQAGLSWETILKKRDGDFMIIVMEYMKEKKFLNYKKRFCKLTHFL